MAEIDPVHFRQTLGRLPTGVTIVTSTDDRGEPIGVACNSFTSVSLDPPLVLACAAKGSSTWPAIRARAAFTVNVLDRHGEWLCRRFAAKGADRFAGVRWTPSPTGPELDGALAWISCTTEVEHEAGDHVIVVARVVGLSQSGLAGPPLVFHRGRYGSFFQPVIRPVPGLTG
ncbi:flavin reductase family protein [Saccharothrix australiensis]|uniref:Flavin reductase (DIM6/NTAB) family NADH-FMN oxidoreductase RutF n=1 Tax=Saccharothrix australiensis TaxID=2072 RepID=A0A495VX73_9PSEU|nr:flavin reductase family protein [Saccharothrix australiensis]RKT53849.1 flavin reductase (DIM6/NTAB) family NADH-FMN oxidoreductase RutF [Saccharothrix australiensis]